MSVLGSLRHHPGSELILDRAAPHAGLRPGFRERTSRLTGTQDKYRFRERTSRLTGTQDKPYRIIGRRALPMSATHQLKAYLVKDDDAFTSYKDVLRSDISVEEVDLVSPLDGVFLSKETSPRKPGWIRFVQPAVQTEIDRLWTQTSAAVLLLRCCGRIFAFTFGYGRTILRPDCYERDFGLRVVLNCVNPDQIRSADMRRIEEATLLTRRHLRGLRGAEGEWNLVCMGWNLKRMYALAGG